MSDVFTALRASHDRLAGLAAGLSPDRAAGPAFPTEWSIAQVFSHIGSGAEIMSLSVDAGLAGAPAPGRDANPPIWDRWNAKQTWAQVTEGVNSDLGLVTRFESLDDQQRAQLRFGSFMGEVDAERLARLRLSEHAVHTWDIAAALDPAATIGPESVGLVLESIGRVVGFAGKSQGLEMVVAVVTTDPERTFTLTLADRVSLEAGAPEGAPATVALPAEALIRLVYGRLDPAHTPPVTVTGVDLDDLRRTFPGF